MRFCVLILLLTTLAGGCAWWEQPPSKGRLSFPRNRLAPDAVALELGVAQLDSSQSHQFDSFWSQLDEQELPLELRKLLDQNGLCAAIMSSRPPAVLHELVNPAVIEPELLNEFERQLHAQGLLRPKPRMITHDRISNREGQSHLVPVSDLHPEMSWIVRNGDQQTPQSAQSVRGVMSVTTYPQGDGSVEIYIRPEIHHGQSRSRFGSGQREFLFESGQSVIPLNDLRFSVSLRAGESLIIAPTRDIAALGRLFFGTEPPDTQESKQPFPTHRILMIRVVQTQMDDLFSDSNLGEKLSTAIHD